MGSGRAKELKTRGQDGLIVIEIKDAPFDRPVMSRYVSDGTLKMLSCLVVLMDPEPPQFIGIEEPENFLHPRLLLELAEECRSASERSQLLVTTHSPFFLNGLTPEEVRVIYRAENGYSEVARAADIKGIPEFVNAGASMGSIFFVGLFHSLFQPGLSRRTLTPSIPGATWRSVWPSPDRCRWRCSMCAAAGFAPCGDGASAAGSWTVQWDGRDGRGQPVPSRTYFVMVAPRGGEVAISKVVLAK